MTVAPTHKAGLGTMNILLVYPEYPQTFWSYTHALGYIDKKAMLPPLGLLTVAALLPESWGKRLVDQNVTTLSDDDLAWADAVFVSGMSIQRHAARQLVARCKAAGKVVVGGGPLFTAEYALFQDVDHFVLNEAELTLPPFIADVRRGHARRMYRSREFADMAQSPTPMWTLADLDQYYVAGIQFSRGCPYDCDFCNVTSLLGRRPRTKNRTQILAELPSLHDAGWSGPVFFVDDNLIGDRPAAKRELLPALNQWQQTRGSTVFNTQVSINLAGDKKMVRDLVHAGFDTVFVGIETPDPGGLEECHKAQNRNRDLIRDVKSLQRAGLDVQAGFILGFDCDNASTFQVMQDFIQDSGIVTAMVGLLQSVPGTKLHDRLRAEGRLTGISSGDNADGTTNIVPRMGLPRLLGGYQNLLERIYSPRLYYQRIRTFLREYPARTGLRRPSPANLRAFLRALYRIGIVGRERLEFWKLLVWTITRNPALLYAAVRLAIYGQHYRRVFESRVRRSDDAPQIPWSAAPPPESPQDADAPQSRQDQAPRETIAV